jgi:hypothetical protein
LQQVIFLYEKYKIKKIVKKLNSFFEKNESIIIQNWHLMLGSLVFALFFICSSLYFERMDVHWFWTIFLHSGDFNLGCGKWL